MHWSYAKVISDNADPVRKTSFKKSFLFCFGNGTEMRISRYKPRKETPSVVILKIYFPTHTGFPQSSVSKESPAVQET